MNEHIFPFVPQFPYLEKLGIITFISGETIDLGGGAMHLIRASWLHQVQGNLAIFAKGLMNRELQTGSKQIKCKYESRW